MKKMMTLVLALSLCLGMSLSSFASHKLYLANTPLEVDNVDEAPALEDNDAPTVGGAENVNLNPGTGR